MGKGGIIGLYTPLRTPSLKDPIIALCSRNGYLERTGKLGCSFGLRVWGLGFRV